MRQGVVTAGMGEFDRSEYRDPSCIPLIVVRGAEHDDQAAFRHESSAGQGQALPTLGRSSWGDYTLMWPAEVTTWKRSLPASRKYP